MALNGGKTWCRNRKMDRIFMFLKIIWPQEVVCPCPGANSCIGSSVLKTSCPVKPLGQLKRNFIM